MTLNLGQREDVRKFLLDVARLVVAMAILAPLAKPEAVLKLNGDGG